MPDPINAMTDTHHDAEELLPWYATGKLEGEDLTLVEEHLSSCAHCRRQLAFERRMIEEFSGLTPEVDSGWARLRQRLEPSSQVPLRPSWRSRIGRDVSAIWQGFNRPAVAAMAFAQLAFVLIAGALLLSLSRPSYRALSSSSPPQSANAIAMFRPDTKESELRGLLQANGASLVGGPTSAGAYLLRVPAQSRPAVLAGLRGDRHVVMAEAIDGPRP